MTPREGDVVQNATQYWVTEAGSKFCFKGAGCAPERQQGNVIAKLENCELDLSRPEIQADGSVLYYFRIIRSEVEKDRLRVSDVKNRLAELGVGLAPADNMARFYVQKPNSSCGRRVLAALEGDPDALRGLLNGNSDCVWDYES